MNYNIENVNIKENLQIVNECEKIAQSNNYKNGGTLTFSNLISGCNYLIIAKNEKEIIGYLALKIYDVFENSIYIEQIAIKNEFKKQGVATNLIKFAINEFKDKFSIINAHVRITNDASNGLFKKLNFTKLNCDIDKMLNIGFSLNDIDKGNYYEFYLNKSKQII